jgi:magnesium transporter
MRDGQTALALEPDRSGSHHNVLRTDTVREHLVTRVPTAAPEETAGATLDKLCGQCFDYAAEIFVVDQDRTLQGVLPLHTLLAAPAQLPLRDLVQGMVPQVTLDMDQEHAASIALRHGLTALPVSDKAHGFMGVVPPAALMAVLREEHVEDLHRLAGIRRETAHARIAIEAPPARRARDRLPWLLAGLAGSIIATLVMARFERILKSTVAVAFFVPAIVYLADAIGTQTEAIAVRGLSLTHAPIGRLIAGELRTGLLIGLILGGIAFPAVWLAFHDVRLAASVALALLGAGSLATTIGVLFPWLLARLDKDPAYGSGPIGTIIQDVLSLLIYLGVVSMLIV